MVEGINAANSVSDFKRTDRDLEEDDDDEFLDNLFEDE